MVANRGWKTRLEALLRHWAARRLPDETELAELGDRILSRWAEESCGPGVQRNGGHASVLRHRIVWVASAAALVTVLVAVIGLIGRFMVPGPAPVAEEQVSRETAVWRNEIAEFGPSRRAEMATVFLATERLFGGHLAWVAETGREVRLGLHEEGGPSADRPLVAIRVWVARRAAASSPWSQVWSVDLVGRSDEFIHIPLDAAGELHLWAFVLPDGMVAVDTDLAVKGAPGAGGVAANLCPPATPVLISSWTEQGVEYGVFQAAAVLDMPKRDAG